MRVTTSLLVEAFLRLCSNDRRLTDSIAHLTITCEADGMRVIILPEPGRVRWISRRLFKIARLFLLLGNLKTITVRGNNRPLTFLASDLIDTCPAVAVIGEGVQDRAHHQEIAARK